MSKVPKEGAQPKGAPKEANADKKQSGVERPAKKPQQQHADPAPAAAANPPVAAASPPKPAPRAPAAAAAASSSATADVTPATSAPSGGGGGLPTSYPNSMVINALKDKTLVGYIEEEHTLRNEVGTIRGKLRKVSDEKDASLRKFGPLQDKFLTEVKATIDKLHDRRSALLNELDKMKIEAYALSEARDALRMLDFEAHPLTRSINELKHGLQVSQTALEQLEKQQRNAAAPTLEFKTIADADRELSRLEEAIEAARKENSNNSKPSPVIAALAKQKAHAEKCKKLIFASYAADDKIIAEREKVVTMTADLATKQAEKDKAEKTRVELKEKLVVATAAKEASAASTTSRRTFDIVRAELEKLRKELDDAVARRKKERPVNAGIDDISAAQGDLRKRRDGVEKRLTELRSLIQYHTATIDPAFRQEVIGRNGATLAQLQADFGVAINIESSRDHGTVYLLGATDDIAACVQAMQAIIAEAKRVKQNETIPFDATLKRGFIGQGGSNIEKLQSASGASIKFLSDTELSLTGTVEAIASAKALVEQFAFSNARSELTFDPQLQEMLIGKAGATIRRIEQESGATRVTVIREENKIVATGNRDAVAKAKQLYEELITGLTKNVFTMKCDERMIRTVIGKGGKTIQEIQQTSGAHINTSSANIITIRGAVEAVALARKMIEDVGRRDEIRIPFEPTMFSFLSSRRKGSSSALDQQDATEAVGAAAAAEEPSVLDKIQNATRCDQIVALRAESVVIVRGRKECVAHAKQLVEMALLENRPHIVRVPFHEVFTVTLTKRAGSDRASILDRLRTAHTGVLSIEVNRQNETARTLDVAGTKDAAEAAAVALREELARLTTLCRKFIIPVSKVPQLIGRQGKTINDLQKNLKADVMLNKTTGEVTVFLGPQVVDPAVIDAAAAAVLEAATSTAPASA